MADKHNPLPDSNSTKSNNSQSSYVVPGWVRILLGIIILGLLRGAFNFPKSFSSETPVYDLGSEVDRDHYLNPDRYNKNPNTCAFDNVGC